LQRPLTAAQLDYAAQDVVHLPQLHALLAEKLAALGRSGWLAEDCRRLIERVCRAVPDTQPQRAFRGAADWPAESQALLAPCTALARRERTHARQTAALDSRRRACAESLRATARDGNELFERSKACARCARRNARNCSRCCRRR